DQGVRDWIAGLDAATGRRVWLKYTIPAPGEPGSETWKGNTNAWRTGGAAVWVTGTYDTATNQTLWGTGNPVPMFDPFYRPGGNLNPNEPPKKVCPSLLGGNNYWPSSYSSKTKLLYIPALSNCSTITIDREKHNKERGWNGGLASTAERWESDLKAADPLTGE